jgi:hypothetical protein
MGKDDEIDNTEDFLDQIKQKIEPGPPCPFCDEPMQLVDGDYLCLDCNGGQYGPETG